MATAATSSEVASSKVAKAIRTDGFKSLLVWQRGMDLAVGIYKATESFPRHELYGLTSQLRRAAASHPANIAEGYGRNSRKEDLQFLSIAYASLNEVETFLILSLRLGYLRQDQHVALEALRREAANLTKGYRKSRQR